MRTIARLVFSIGIVSVVGCGGAPAPPFKLVADTKTLMDSVIEKQANVVWESVGTIATLEGVEERRPKTDEDWKSIKDAAVTITESANLLMMSPHAKDNEEWMAASAGLIEQGQRMVSAIDRKSPQDVFDVGADMYEACVRCHRQYMPGVAIMYRR